MVKGKEKHSVCTFSSVQGDILRAKSKKAVCPANRRGNILSPGKGWVLCLRLQWCQEDSKDNWESCMIIMFLFIYT